MFFWRNSVSIVKFALLLATFGCAKKAEISTLYDLDSLVSSQVTLLSEGNASLSKTATMGTVTEDTTYSPGNADAWNLELGVFRDLNVINKPINRDKYIVDDGLFDVHSNLTVRAYSAIEEIPVRYVRVFYSDSFERPRKIEALYRDENILSKQGRLITMDFQQVNNEPLLTGYSIVGGQKIIFGDTVMFDVKGKIIFN